MGWERSGAGFSESRRGGVGEEGRGRVEGVPARCWRRERGGRGKVIQHVGAGHGAMWLRRVVWQEWGEQ